MSQHQSGQNPGLCPQSTGPQPCLSVHLNITAGNLPRWRGPFQRRNQTRGRTPTENPIEPEVRQPPWAGRNPRRQLPTLDQGTEAHECMETAAGCSWGHLGPLTPLQKPMSRAGQAAAIRTLERGGAAIMGPCVLTPRMGPGTHSHCWKGGLSPFVKRAMRRQQPTHRRTALPAVGVRQLSWGAGPEQTQAAGTLQDRGGHSPTSSRTHTASRGQLCPLCSAFVPPAPVTFPVQCCSFTFNLGDPCSPWSLACPRPKGTVICSLALSE